MTAYTDAEVLIAQVVHGAALGLRYEQGDPVPAAPWQCAPAYMRETVLDGVRRAMNGETPEQHHEAWCERLRADGWTLGPKDYDARTHPWLVPYDQLPREQQVKNRVFLAIVKAMTA